MEGLKEIAKEIRDVLDEKREQMELSFVEDTHTYYIKGLDGKVTADLPSVSTVLKSFYRPFIAEEKRAFKNCNGDKAKEKALLKEWADSGTYAAYKGSRVHYILEQELVKQYGDYKEVRKPIFECDETQIEEGDQMIIAGKEYLDLMHARGAILLDTEMVLGSADFGYTGQPDKVWLMIGKDGKLGIVISDYKTNKPKNFEVHKYTVIMKPPFEKYWDTALGHYYVQIPLYAKLLLKMLEGTKYQDIPFLGGIVLLLKKDATFEEYRIPQDVINTVLNMNVRDYIK